MIDLSDIPVMGDADTVRRNRERNEVELARNKRIMGDRMGTMSNRRWQGSNKRNP